MKWFVILAAIINALVCYACCVIAGRADDEWENIEYLMFIDDEDDE